jgi:hypothetical protein
MLISIVGLRPDSVGGRSTTWPEELAKLMGKLMRKYSLIYGDDPCGSDAYANDHPNLYPYGDADTNANAHLDTDPYTYRNPGHSDRRVY